MFAWPSYAYELESVAVAIDESECGAGKPQVCAVATKSASERAW